MAKQYVPLRPDNEGDYSTLTETEKNMIAFIVLFGVSNDLGFAIFNPQYCPRGFGKINPTGKVLSEQFFAFARHIQYIKDYRRTLDEYLANLNKEEEAPKRVYFEDDSSENAKERAVNTFTNRVYRQMENAMDLQEMLDVANLGKTVKIFKEEEEKVLPPQRYLPIRCFECEYKKFVDEQIKAGNIVRVEVEGK
jgi:DNA-directed RNA polymerase subunit N (RpoN/RPB10)